ncbi:Calx-beta domain-containing protein [Aquimarina pacifica]|uniref:Calx-beta domain-containing protein n=1 Tax=Aquimarina pacifica TaxID=1296415 RepID=UPI00046F88DB|nr:Calx-beta domain-containing protein [Aquimarina pacifica]
MINHIKTIYFKQLVIVISLVLLSNSVYGQEYEDDFNGGTDYSNSSGALNWTTSWIEVNDGGSGAAGGRIEIVSNQLELQNIQNGGGGGSSRSISRVIDLSAHTAVTLTLDYNRTAGDESVDVDLWNNTTSSWETVATTAASGTITHILTANQISAFSEIRFISGSGNWGGGGGVRETVYIDDVRFTPTVTTPSISIDDVTVDEDAGTAVFTVTHSGASTTGSFTVEYATADNSAVAPGDYTATTGTPTITFSGTSPETQTITISITDDGVEENLETFFVDLSNPSDGSVTISDSQGIGTIVDEDALIMSNGSVTTCSANFYDSGGSGAEYSNNEPDYVYTICPDTPGSQIVVDFTFFEVEDAGGTIWDYLQVYDGTGTGTLIGTYYNTDGSNSPGTITSSATDGCLTFLFHSDGSITEAGWEATVSCTVTTPELSIDDVTVNENAGTLDFTVSHTGSPTTGSFTVEYATADNSAIAPGDYTATTGTPTLTFVGTSLSTQTISIPIVDDNIAELAETFFVNLSNVSDPSVTIADTQGEGTINADDLGTVAVNSISVSENVGTATYTVTLSGGDIPGGFTVDYTTADNTAVAGSDYTATSGTLNFSGTDGETQIISVPIIDNSFAEANETFFINLSALSSGLVSLGSNGTETITDDGDPAIPSNVPLTLFDEFNGYYDYALTGGTFRDSDTNTCSIVTSSSNTLTTTIPGSAVIEKAYLFWSHSGDEPDESVTFAGQTVFAQVINEATFGVQPYYGMVSDVTSVVNNPINVPDPATHNYTVTDLTIDNTDNTWFYCGGNTTLGGWSLMIFYTDTSLPAVSINLYNGFDGEQNSFQSYTLSGFFAIGSTGSKTSILSWEGDPGTDNVEQIQLTTTAGTTTLSGDGDNNGTTVNNPFNSTIYDDTAVPIVNDTDGRGLDLDTYDISPLIAQGESSATTAITAGGDFTILNAVLIKVPSNLITGTIFEDINYPGGYGRDITTASGVGIEGVTVELYDNSGNLEDSDITDVNGDYNIGGMANGTYTLRVVNSTVTSTRGGGDTCTACLPVQTFRAEYASNSLTNITEDVGGVDPAAQDTAAGILTGAQSISTITILNEGAVDVDFGFNFNTIVNTNENGQGSLEQFIINSNGLDETGLNIEANSIFNPAAGEDISIFMIPPTSDVLNRPADSNFTSGYFDIFIDNAVTLTTITDNNTHIDGRTQTAYSGDTNTGTVGSGGTTIGTSATALPTYNLPEIQIHRNDGDVLKLQGDDNVIRNVAVYANNNAGVRIESGSSTVTENLLGVNADGTFLQNIDYGVEVTGGTAIISSNYIADNTDAGILINGGTSSLIQNNHITDNGENSCRNNIIVNNGSGVVIQNNLIENGEALNIDDRTGNVTITENTITASGTNVACTENYGIKAGGNNSIITNNIIFSNAGAGVAITGGSTSGNLISQNSIYANGTLSDALGIDINADGVSINDSGDPDAGPNGTLNFPVFESITVSGTTLNVIGWSRPGATIEFFITDINQGTATAGDNALGLTQDYGEGQIYIGSATEGSVDDSDGSSSSYSDADGNADNTNKFNFNLTLGSTIPVGTTITATATISNTTSEFGNTYPVTGATVITNRRITYRVTPALTSPTGTLTTDLIINNFDDGQNGAGNSYQLQIQNNTAVGFNYQIWVQNVPYASIPGLTLTNHTLNTIDNGDGTYSYLFTSTTALGAFQNRMITGSGGAPTPLGSGPACGCVTFYKL